MRVARSTGAASGLAVAVLGVWGAVIPFIGPYFNYSFENDVAWHYTSNRLWLCVLPGAAALVAGLLMIVADRRSAGLFAGWLAVLAGGWFIIGPSVSRIWEHGEGPIGMPLHGDVRQAAELVGYFYGLGAIIVCLAAFAMGRFASRPHLEAREGPSGARTRARAEGPGGEGAARAEGPLAGPESGESPRTTTSTGEGRRRGRLIRSRRGVRG